MPVGEYMRKVNRKLGGLGSYVYPREANVRDFADKVAEIQLIQSAVSEGLACCVKKDSQYISRRQSAAQYI